MSRLDREELFIGMAHLFAQRSTCVRGQVGCVIVNFNHVISHGYNGAPAGMKHCTEVGCGGGVPPKNRVWGPELQDLDYPNGCTRAIHAEANSIAYAARVGVQVLGSRLYTTDSPCIACAKLSIAAGIQHVIYDRLYRVQEGLDLLLEAGVTVEQRKP